MEQLRQIQLRMVQVQKDSPRGTLLDVVYKGGKITHPHDGTAL
jgi:hypothetical protein